ncbi:MAG: efflux RND transporter permease subunit [Candidatus Eremiobacteraeota bacterium]|nr:efflux RND transporter permease subunit [Candidatus Eremiobacteraeota bacterium]
MAFFLRRPIFAAVCSLVILLVGAVSLPTLPVAHYPNIAPPTVTVQAFYTGASAQAVESSVTTPLELAINGVQGLRYMSSKSGNDGSSEITCVFDLGRDLDKATNDVQNAVQSAQGRLPNEVKLTGVTVSKNSGAFVMAIAIYDQSGTYDQTFLSNYVDLNVLNRIQRVPGVGNVILFGERKYAMRLWVDPKRLADNGLTADDLTNAIQNQNRQAPAGSIGSAPTDGHQPYQFSVRVQGRLADPAQFGNIILRSTPNGGFVKVRDVARVELGAEDYSVDLGWGNKNSVGLGVLQLSTANSMVVSHGVRAALQELSQAFPPGVHYAIGFDSTLFVEESIREVVLTLAFAILLVVAVIFLFLQDWRTTLIPAMTIPVSLVGTFAVMKVLGFSVNSLTLFGLTLATGLVVDDAIVVIENIARYIQEKKFSPFDGARAGLLEIASAVIATTLVLLAVFIPVAFFPGTTGQLYKQFALTIAISVAISGFVALTLTPTLSELLIRQVDRAKQGRFFRWFNERLLALRNEYDRVIPRLISLRGLVVVLFAIGLAGTGFMYDRIPKQFIPDEDQGYFIVILQTPEGSSLDFEKQIAHRVSDIIGAQSEVEGVFNVMGWNFNGAAPNHGVMFAPLKPWAERKGRGHDVASVVRRVQFAFFGIPGAQIFAINPPAIQGGSDLYGGFTFEIEDHANHGLDPLFFKGLQFMFAGNSPQNPQLSRVFTTFRVDSPQLLVDVDRDKAASVGIPIESVFSAMQVFLGSEYVNDFDYLARSYRVYVQADRQYRSRLDELQRIYVASSNGASTPLTAVASFQRVKTAPVITHYNGFRSVELSGQPGPGFGTSQAIDKMQQLAAGILPRGSGYQYEWTGLALEQIESGSATFLIFALGIVFVFLVLSAQYESFIDPFIILLAVPFALFGALGLLMLRHIESDVFAQVGYVMLIGLASKNAILIVEFANKLRAAGKSAVDAVREAAETRLRPILMTSFAFILGVTPLVFATGAGAEERHSLGTAVFGGMLVSTFLNLLIIPVMYVLIVGIEDRFRPRHGPPTRTSALPVVEGQPLPEAEAPR